LPITLIISLVFLLLFCKKDSAAAGGTASAAKKNNPQKSGLSNWQTRSKSQEKAPKIKSL
jgi:hypothetical protein